MMVFLAALPLATRAAVALAVLLFLAFLAALAAHVTFFWRRASARAVGMRNGGGETMGASGEVGVVRARFEPRSLRASVEARRLALGGVAGWGVPGGALPGWMATGALPPPLWHHWCQHHLQRATRQTRHPSVVHRTVEGLLFSLTRLIWQRTQRAFPLSPPSHLHGFPFSCGKQAKAPVSRAAGSPSSYYSAYAALSGAHFALSRWLWDSS